MLVVALLTAIVVGLVPAMKASRPDVARALIGDAVVAGASRRWFSMRNGLVMTQIAVSTLLLLMAGEFVNSFVMISSFETGIPRTDRALIRLNLAANRYDREQGARFLASLMTRAREAGDLRAFTIASRLPAGSVTNDGVTILSAASDRELLRAAATAAIAPGLFETLGIPLRQGRDFNDYDIAGSPGVAIVSATAAQRFWPNRNPLGQRLSLLRGVWLEVVGVAADTRAHAIEGNEAVVYIPLTQRPSSQVVLIGASADGTAGAIVAMRRIVRDLDQDMAMGESTTVGNHLATFTYQYWIAAVVLGSLGGLALFLASLGIYGVLSYLVAEQTREVGVRMALGANAVDVMRLILWQGMRVVGRRRRRDLPRLAGRARAREHVELGRAGAAGLARRRSHDPLRRCASCVLRPGPPRLADRSAGRAAPYLTSPRMPVTRARSAA
jgi:hypothetical protein